MLKATHLTEEQWFSLCLRVYKALKQAHWIRAVQHLEGVGFRSNTTDPGG